MAYKALANKYHPDRNPNCEKSLRAMQAINAAYEVLIDPYKRKKHDSWIFAKEEKIKANVKQDFQSSPPPPPPPPPPRYKTAGSPPSCKSNSQKNNGGVRLTTFGGLAAIVMVVTFTVVISIGTMIGFRSPSENSFDGKNTTEPIQLTPVDIPNNGELVVKANYTVAVPFQIQSQVGADYVVKLIDVNSGEDVMTIFVKGGETLQTRAPLGRYLVKYASGNSWYGYDHLFGSATIYSKVEILNFKRSDTSPSQSRLFDLQKRLSALDADLRDFLTSKGMTEIQASYVFEGTNVETGESGIDRLPTSYWENLLTRINNRSLRKGIADRLKSRNIISNQIAQIRNSEQEIEILTINLYNTREINAQQNTIDSHKF